jgi:hypothetical protein
MHLLTKLSPQILGAQVEQLKTRFYETDQNVPMLSAKRSLSHYNLEVHTNERMNKKLHFRHG